jgi:hypothetical protein
MAILRAVSNKEHSNGRLLYSSVGDRPQDGHLEAKVCRGYIVKWQMIVEYYVLCNCWIACCILCIVQLSDCMLFIVYCATVRLHAVYCVLWSCWIAWCILCIVKLLDCMLYIVYCEAVGLHAVYCVLWSCWIACCLLCIVKLLDCMLYNVCCLFACLLVCVPFYDLLVQTQYRWVLWLLANNELEGTWKAAGLAYFQAIWQQLSRWSWKPGFQTEIATRDLLIMNQHLDVWWTSVFTYCTFRPVDNAHWWPYRLRPVDYIVSCTCIVHTR